MVGHRTLRQVLTGTTGIAYDDTTRFRALVSTRDPARYVISLPCEGKASSTWSYNDAALALLTPVLESAPGDVT